MKRIIKREAVDDRRLRYEKYLVRRNYGRYRRRCTGIPVQFLDRGEIKRNPVTGMRGYGTFNMPEGTWSDDGSLTLATLESIFTMKGIDYQDIMENFADWLLDGKFTPFGYSFDQGSTCIKAITNYIKIMILVHVE